VKKTFPFSLVGKSRFVRLRRGNAKGWRKRKKEIEEDWGFILMRIRWVGNQTGHEGSEISSTHPAPVGRPSCRKKKGLTNELSPKKRQTDTIWPWQKVKRSGGAKGPLQTVTPLRQASKHLWGKGEMPKYH